MEDVHGESSSHKVWNRHRKKDLLDSPLDSSRFPPQNHNSGFQGIKNPQVQEDTRITGMGWTRKQLLKNQCRTFPAFSISEILISGCSWGSFPGRQEHLLHILQPGSGHPQRKNGSARCGTRVNHPPPLILIYDP